MKRGVVIGKFYPPHAGHQHLIDTALKQVDLLTIIVCQTAEETIPGALRAEWIAEIDPAAEVRLISWDGLDPNDSRLWADITRRLLGYAPDVVFTSEDYGDAYARFLGSTHVLVDRARAAVPVSGTRVRQSPLESWQYLAGPVRAYYAKRVCILGAESTGTTTLAQDLARRYTTCWVPEYGRLYYEGRMQSSAAHRWSTAEFVHIARAQNELEDALARRCNRVLICDTDAFATTIWHRRYVGVASPDVESIARGRSIDLYILTDTDIPFAQDGTRDGEHLRSWMHATFIEELERWQKVYMVVSGGRARRLRAAVAAIDAMLPELMPSVRGDSAQIAAGADALDTVGGADVPADARRNAGGRHGTGAGP